MMVKKIGSTEFNVFLHDIFLNSVVVNADVVACINLSDVNKILLTFLRGEEIPQFLKIAALVYPFL